jgi:hypothetical protein
MSEAIIKKNGTDYPLLTMPNHYPGDRVYLDGDTTKNVQDAVDKSQAMIATVQPNLTAVKAYAKGDQFIYNGLLYIFTTSCAQGGTITIGGNCELSPSVTEQIDNISIKQVELSTSTDLNNCTDEYTTYFITGANRPINAPTDSAYNQLYWVRHFSGTTGIVQFCACRNSPELYMRFRWAGDWGSWVKMNTTTVS